MWDHIKSKIKVNQLEHAIQTHCGHIMPVQLRNFMSMVSRKENQSFPWHTLLLSMFWLAVAQISESPTTIWYCTTDLSFSSVPQDISLKEVEQLISSRGGTPGLQSDLILSIYLQAGEEVVGLSILRAGLVMVMNSDRTQIPDSGSWSHAALTPW